MRRSWATSVYLAVTGLFVLVAFFQPFTFALGYFGAIKGFGLHQAMGFIVLHGLTVLALVAALISPARRRDGPWALGLFVLVTAQIFLVGARDDAPGVAALHPLLGVTAIGVAVWAHLLARRTPRAAPPATA